MQRSVSALLLGAAAFVSALTACSGGKNANTSTTTTKTTTQSSPGASPSAMQSSAQMAKAGASMKKSNGSAVYTANCASCHQANGKGQAGVFPPLAGNAVVTGDPKKVIHIVKNGLSGKITVGSMTFNGQMPAWKGTLSNNDIAAVITYVRSSWGNHGSAVTASQVASTP